MNIKSAQKKSFRMGITTRISLVFYLSAIFALASCQPPSSTAGSHQQSSTLTDTTHAIQQTADSFLIALAVRNYQNLAQLVDPSSPVFTNDNHQHLGKQASLALLGPYEPYATLQGWNARSIKVTLDSDPSWATAQIALKYQATPNRPQLRKVISLRFHLTGNPPAWLCFLSPSP